MLNAFTTVVDAGKCKMYMKNFGEFFNDQIEHAGTVIMSHADTVKGEKLKTAVELVREKNPTAVIVTTPISELDANALKSAIERKDTLEEVMKAMHIEHHHHHEHEEDCDCGCHEHGHHHHHEHGEDCDCGCHEHGHHHHHEHAEDCDCGCHEHGHHHHHEHGEDCDCGCHDHHHHHHHADEVFVSLGRETTKKFTDDEIKSVLDSLCDEAAFGIVLRAKGIVDSADGNWIHFDYTPGESDVRKGSAGIIGRICVIGSGLNEKAVEEAFGL